MTVQFNSAKVPHRDIFGETSSSASTTSGRLPSSNPMDIPGHGRRRRTERASTSSSIEQAYPNSAKLERVITHYNMLQTSGSLQEMANYFELLYVIESHAHAEGKPLPVVLWGLACKQEQLYLDLESDELVEITKNQTPSDKQVPLKNAPHVKAMELKAKMADVKGSDGVSHSSEPVNPLRSHKKFFDQCDVRGLFANAIGFVPLFKRNYELFKEEKVVSAELMAVLIPYKPLERYFGDLWKKKSSFKEFLNYDAVKEWVTDFIRQCQSTLDEFEGSINSNRRSDLKKINCFDVDLDDKDNENVAIGLVYELMRDFDPELKYEFFMRLAAVCELIRRDSRRVVSFTLCGPQGDQNSLENEEDIAAMLEFMSGEYKQDFSFNPHISEVSPLHVDAAYVEAESKIIKWATRRVGHATRIAFNNIDLLLKNDLAVEVCLKSNEIILGVKPKDHICKTLVKRGVPIVLCADNPGQLGSSLKDNYAEAAISCGFSLEQIFQFVRDSATYSHRKGDSIYAKQNPGEPRRSVLKPTFTMSEVITGQFSDEMRAFLAASPRARLEVVTERCINKFIERTADKLALEERDFRRHLNAQQAEALTINSL